MTLEKVLPKERSSAALHDASELRGFVTELVAPKMLGAGEDLE